MIYVELSKRAKITAAALVFVVLIITGLIARVNSHTVHSFKETSLTLDEVKKECPYLIITDDEKHMADQILKLPEIQAGFDKASAVVVDKALADRICSKTIPDFKSTELSVSGSIVCLDGRYETNRCIFTISENSLISKTVTLDSKTVYENANNLEFKKYTQHLDITKSILN